MTEHDDLNNPMDTFEAVRLAAEEEAEMERANQIALNISLTCLGAALTLLVLVILGVL